MVQVAGMTDLKGVCPVRAALRSDQMAVCAVQIVGRSGQGAVCVVSGVGRSDQIVVCAVSIGAGMVQGDGRSGWVGVGAVRYRVDSGLRVRHD
jgi:hypothetical protein